jgi:hypothetical protein
MHICESTTMYESELQLPDRKHTKTYPGRSTATRPHELSLSPHSRASNHRTPSPNVHAADTPETHKWPLSAISVVNRPAVTIHTSSRSSRSRRSTSSANPRISNHHLPPPNLPSVDIPETHKWPSPAISAVNRPAVTIHTSSRSSRSRRPPPRTVRPRNDKQRTSHCYPHQTTHRRRRPPTSTRASTLQPVIPAPCGPHGQLANDSYPPAQGRHPGPHLTPRTAPARRTPALTPALVLAPAPTPAPTPTPAALVHAHRTRPRLRLRLVPETDQKPAHAHLPRHDIRLHHAPSPPHTRRANLGPSQATPRGHSARQCTCTPRCRPK